MNISEEGKEENILQKEPKNYDCKDIWLDNEDDCDNILSQAYDLYLSQSKSKDTENVVLSDLTSSSLNKDVDTPHTQESTSHINTRERKKQNLTKPICKSPEHGLDTQEYGIESENESLFGGDFSDDDPSYIPPDLSVPSKHNNISEDSNLIQLEELLYPNVFSKSERSSTDDNNNESLYVTQSIMDEVFKLSWKHIKPRARWNKRDPVTWKRNIVKKRRAEGLPYETLKKCRQPKIPKPVDCSKCKFECNTHVSESIREELCRKYWNLDFVAKKAFILAHINIKETKRILLQRTRATRRSYCKQCFFIIEGEKKNVCQDFFCRTLAISPCVINNAVKQRDNLGQYSKVQDPRGRREPPNKTSPEVVEVVKNHIASFPSMESHYVRKKTKRRYLEAGLTLSKMYSLYVNEHKMKNTSPAVSEMTYRRIFSTEFNLGFYVPKKDQCLLCTKYKRANDEEKANLKNQYEEHMQRKEICNREKEKDKKRAEDEANVLSVSFDLQAILQIPSTDVGLLYYTRKLTLYNLTIYENAPPNEAYCFAWNEANGKKGSAEIGTILYYYLTTCVPKNITEISLFSDTCGGQNRNQYVASILLWLMMQNTQLNVVEHKFLESGHSYMEADSMHSAIERSKKNCDVYCMSDWLNIFKRARSKKIYRNGAKRIIKNCYNVKEFKYYEFKDLKTLSETVMVNRNKNTDGERVNWLKIKRMRYMKGDKKLYYNYDMSTDFMALDVTKSDAKVNSEGFSTLPRHGYSTRKKERQQNNDKTLLTNTRDIFPPLQQLYDGPLPISIAKKKDLVNLCNKGVIPEEYHGWFKSLATEASQADRLPTATMSEDSSCASQSSSDE